MSQMSQITLLFNEEEHKYYLKERPSLSFTSVSKLIGLVKQPFDIEFWSKKKAEERGITQEEILQEWEDKKIQSQEKGTRYHLMREQKLLNHRSDSYPSLVCEETNQKKAIDLKTLKPGIYPELILYNLQHGIVGTADIVEIFEDGTFVIGDYKGFSLDTLIPTPTGFITMGEIKEQDEIFDGNGKITKVKHVSKVHYNPCYKITFDTNDEVICDHEHRWIINTNLGKKLQEQEMTTEEMYAQYEKTPLMIQCTKINTTEKNLPIDPYVLGLWLGDGDRTAGTITCVRPEIWKEVESRGYSVSVNHNRNHDKAESRTVFGIRSHLKELNLIGNKHIPDIYLRASHEQRLDLLRGFLDADGHFHKKRKRVVMNTTKEWQATAIMELTASLGIKPTLLKSQGRGFGLTVKTWQVCFLSEENPFLCRNKDYLEIVAAKSKFKSKYRYIKKIEKIETVPTKCIAVESETRTYLVTKSFIKTHNTNQELKFNSFKKFDPISKERRPVMMQPPLEHLEDCNGIHYTLQLSLYACMLEQFGYKCKGLTIYHAILNEDEELINEVEYPLNYRKKEAQTLMKWFKEKHSKQTS